MRHCIPVLALLFVCLASGCGSKSSEAQAQNALDAMKELTAAVVGGDREKVMAVAMKIKALVKEGKTKKGSAEEERRVNDKYKPLFMEETKKMQAAMVKSVASGKLKPEDLKEVAEAIRQ